MAKTTDQLLKKKTWTGAEVGHAYLINLAEERKANREKKPFKPVFTRADLDKMTNSINTAEDYNAYLCYYNLYSGLVEGNNITEAAIQQFYNGFYRYLYTLKDCKEADRALQAVTRYPLIMTQAQYDRIKEEIIAKRKSFNTSYYSILLELVEYYASNEEEAPAAVKKAIEATKKQPCTNERILSHYNEDMGEGYYTLEDGTRSDGMPIEQWQQLLQDRFLEKHEYIINGVKASPEETIRFFNTEKVKQCYKMLYGGEDAVRTAFKEEGLDWDALGCEVEPFLECLEEELDHTSTLPAKANSLQDAVRQITETEQSSCIWHDKEELPTGLTKYDILTEYDIFLRYKDGIQDDVAPEQQYKEFKEDYPALYKAVKADLDKHLKKAAALKPCDYMQPIFTFGDTLDSGLKIYEDFLTDITDHDIIDYYCKSDSVTDVQNRQRVAFNGIAILHESSWNSSKVAENGDYIEDSNPYSVLQSLDSITDSEEATEYTLAYRQHLAEPAIKQIYAYNALIDIVAAVYDAECIKELKANTDFIEDKIDALNNMIYLFFSTVYGISEEKRRKRALITQLFQPIEIEDLKPNKETIAQIKKEMLEAKHTSKGAAVLKDLLPLIKRLTERGL